MNVIHDLTPWKVAEATEKKGREIVAADGATIAKLTTLDLANAAMIVKAVNAHDKLVSALRLAKQEMDYQRTYRNPARIDRDRFDALARYFKAALAAAGEPV